MGEQAKTLEHRFTVRGLEEADFMSLSALYRTVFNVEKDESFWRWKYFLNPAGQHMMAVALEPENGRVIGQVGSIPVEMSVGGKRVLGAQTCDIVILPEHQKGGPFFQLHELGTSMLKERGVKILFGYSITKTLKISVRLLKFKSVFPIKRLARVLRPGPFIKQRLNVPILPGVLGSISGQVLRLIYPAPVKVPAGCRLREITTFDERYDRLMERVSSAVKIMVYKGSRYLNWRYVSCPSIDYRILALENDEEVVGFSVFSLEDDEIRRAYILELMADPSRPEAIETLLNQTIRNCYDVGADIVNSWTVEHSPLFGIQRRSGFVPKDTVHNLIVRPHFDEGHNPPDVADPLNWDISLGDSDYH